MEAKIAAEIRAGIALARNFKFRMETGNLRGAQALIKDAMYYGNVSFEAFRREVNK